MPQNIPQNIPLSPLQIMAHMVEIAGYDFLAERALPHGFEQIWPGGGEGTRGYRVELSSVSYVIGSVGIYHDRSLLTGGELTFEIGATAGQMVQVAAYLATFEESPGAAANTERWILDQVRLYGPAGQGADGPVYLFTVPAHVAAKYAAMVAARGGAVLHVYGAMPDFEDNRIGYFNG